MCVDDVVNQTVQRVQNIILAKGLKVARYRKLVCTQEAVDTQKTLPTGSSLLHPFCQFCVYFDVAHAFTSIHDSNL